MAEKRSYRCVPSLQQFYSGGAVAVSSDGSFLACACEEKINIVSSADGSVRATLEGDSETVTALALSPDHRLLFSASHSRLIRVWDLSSNSCLRSWKGHEGPVMGIACHMSGGLIATAGTDRKVLVWDVDGGFCTHFFKGHQGVITSIMFHPDPNCLLLFSGSDDATVRVWNLQTKKCTSVLEKHFSAVTSLDVSEDGQTLLSAGRDKVVNMWSLHDYSFRKTIPTYEILECVHVIPSETSFASYIPQKRKKGSDLHGIYFLTVGEWGIIRVWSDSSTCIYEQQTSDTTFLLGENEMRRGFTTAAILPSNHGLLCVTADQQFLFYCPALSAEGALQLNLLRRLVGYNEEIVDLKFLGEEDSYLAVATNIEQVRVYQLSTMSCSYVLVGHTDIVLCLDTFVSKSGRTFCVSGSKDNNVRLWDTEGQKCIGVGSGHTGAVSAVAFSKKGSHFFVSGSSDRTIKVWNFDALEGAEEGNLKAKAVVIAHEKDINCLAISPNDGLVCSGSQDRTATIWKLPDLISVITLKGHKRGVWSVEFSPVDQCVLTSSGDKTIRIWALSDGSCLKTFEGHTSSVLRASFLSRGTQLASCGADGLVKLWSVKTSECIATFDKHEDKVWALAVGKKTEMLATGGGDAVVNLWYDSTVAEKEEAFKKKEEEVLRGQELENAMTSEDYSRAIRLAFELRHLHKLYKLFELLCRRRVDKDLTKEALCSLNKEEIRQLLECIREWNTKPKLCHVAHFVLFQILKIFPPTEIIEVKGISELLEGLIPYSQRHFVRLDRLARGTFLLDHTLARMSVLEPDKDLVSSKVPARVEGEILQAGNKGVYRKEQVDPSPEKVKKRKSKESSKRREKKLSKGSERGAVI